jgi:hypothetical protein
MPKFLGTKWAFCGRGVLGRSATFFADLLNTPLLLHDFNNNMKPFPPQSTATADRRSASRQNVLQSATLYAENAAVMAPGALVQVNNISTSGINFQSHEASNEGSICRVMIDTDSLRLNSRVRIIRCEKSDEQFTIGAEFVEELPDWTPADN